MKQEDYLCYGSLRTEAVGCIWWDDVPEAEESGGTESGGDVRAASQIKGEPGVEGGPQSRDIDVDSAHCHDLDTG